MLSARDGCQGMMPDSEGNEKMNSEINTFNIGGKFAHKMLAVFVDLQGMQRMRLMNRCKELHIELLGRMMVASE